MALVLVVDDDPLFREIVRELLVQAGYDVALAGNGVEAARIDSETPPDLAVIDMLMPERDGIETIRDLRGRWPGVKTLAVSAGSRGLDPNLLLRAAKAMGADAVLEKPLDHPTLLKLIDELLG
ncbi:MAG TPA: response regulator [Caulobacteraceae bacterium]|jgi:CheY-like chemotaxis protein|nr:response regulator [Caulobacteraceae bacterium]